METKMTDSISRALTDESSGETLLHAVIECSVRQNALFCRKQQLTFQDINLLSDIESVRSRLLKKVDWSSLVVTTEVKSLLKQLLNYQRSNERILYKMAKEKLGEVADFKKNLRLAKSFKIYE